MSVALSALFLWSCRSNAVAAGGTHIVKPPFMDPFEFVWHAGIGAPGSTGTNAPALVGYCELVEIFDSEGDVISSRTVQIGQGTNAGPLPPGGVGYRTLIFVWEDNKKAKSVPGSQQLSSEIGPMGLTLRDFIITGGPLDPAIDESQSSYFVILRAHSPIEALERLESLLAGGAGAVLPTYVTTAVLSTMEFQDTGDVRVTVAGPGTVLEQFRLDFNGVPFYADLATGTNVITYPVGGWSVVETILRSQDLVVGNQPGATYENAGSSTFKTDVMLEPVFQAQAFRYSF